MSYDDRTRLAAVTALHRHGEDPPIPSEVTAAQAALSELIDKHRADEVWSRSTHRAVRHLKTRIDAWDDALVDLARSKGYLPELMSLDQAAALFAHKE